MSRIKEFLVNNEDETRKIAQDFAKELCEGDIVCLYGDLGCGKTSFCKSAIQALGVTELVVSPTFTIVHEYEGRIPVFHFDVYRVHNEEDLFELGYEEYFFGNGICFIEWAELVEGLLPDRLYKVYLEYTEEEDGRQIRIEYPSD